jgi:hypothetical protein
MSRKPTSKRTRPKPKAVLRLPDLDQAKSAVLNSLTSANAQRVTGTPLMNSWSGTARSRGSRSAGPLAPLSNSSRIAKSRSWNNQSSLRSRPTLGL